MRAWVERALVAVAGAGLGYSILWTALFSFPLMAAVQLMCARLGLVTGRGLGGVIRKRYPPWVLWSACLLLIAANVFNIAADLGISQRTVENHRAAIMNRTGARSLPALARLAMSAQWAPDR